MVYMQAALIALNTITEVSKECHVTDRAQVFCFLGFFFFSLYVGGTA